MNSYVQCFVTIPFTVVMFQFYPWIISLKGAEKQRHCNALGITYTTVGTVCFIFRTLPLTLVGLILFMLGLRLLAHGLDRINKTVFIDRSPSLLQLENDQFKTSFVNPAPTVVTQVGDVTTMAMLTSE